MSSLTQKTKSVLKLSLNARDESAQMGAEPGRFDSATPGTAELPTNLEAFWSQDGRVADSPQFREFLRREFPEQREDIDDPLSRRRFVQLMGASLAFAGVPAAGCRWEKEHIVPESRRPDGYVPGATKHYASAWEFGGFAESFLVTAFDGRPIKLEGNAEHPFTGSATTALAQASILELYDPDRARRPSRMENGNVVSANSADVAAFIAKLRQEVLSRGGEGLRILAEPTSSPTVAALRQELLAQLPRARWHEYTPLSFDNEREGTRAAFGAPHRVRLHLDRAAVIAAFDGDLFANHPAALANARGFAAMRDPEKQQMTRVYAVESAFTMTGAAAEHRLPVRAELVKPILLGLEQLVAGGDLASVGASALEDTEIKKFLDVLAADLRRFRGRSVVTVGDRQPPEAHAIAARINSRLGNVDRTLMYLPDADAERPPHVKDLAELVAAMDSGSVTELVMLGGNPAYDAPADFKFAAKLQKVSTSVHLSPYHNETSTLCSWHVNQSHFLESWGDGRTWDGTLTLQQPVIEPLFGGTSVIEVLALLSGNDKPAKSLVEQTFKRLTLSVGDWRKALEIGFVAGTSSPAAPVTLRSFEHTPLTESQKQPIRRSGQLEVVFVPSSHTYDGRFANNGWLVETPDFFTKLTWDNAALISPRTAADLGVAHGEIVVITVDGAEPIEIPVYVMPGQAPYSVALPLGWGRTRAGHVGGHSEWGTKTIGFDTYRARTSGAFDFSSSARLEGTGRKAELALTQDHFDLDELGATTLENRSHVHVQSASMSEYEQNPSFVEEAAHLESEKALFAPAKAGATRLSLFDELKTTKKHNALADLALFDTEKPNPDVGHRWGMTTDLSKCIGCNSCLLACQAENNVPIVGKEQVMKNREMHWIRIDRYFQGNLENPKIAHQPVACQQCESAPCEQVCPVGATVHSNEGLNDMAYNRCVGTRYCANNCPYKVRRFNFFYWHDELDEARAKVRKLLFNPEVTVRGRGVMEKCTWCVQRIEREKIATRNDPDRTLRDGDIKTACEQACPTGAITFGDLNDKKSAVVAKQALPRAYNLLAQLNVKPRHSFLARIENPNAALTPTKQDEHQ